MPKLPNQHSRPPVLTNPRADRVRAVASLGGRAAVRKRRGYYLIEGPQAVREAVGYHADELREVFIHHPDPTPAVAKIGAQARAAGVLVREATAAVMAAISPNTQGIAAVAAMPHTRNLATLTPPQPPALVTYLPEISDPGNLGTLIRIADAAGAQAVIVGPTCVEVTNPKVIRASAGSIFHLPIIAARRDDDVVRRLKTDGYQLIGADGYGATWLPTSRAASGEAVAWIFGNEAHGLPPALRDAVDEIVAIPLYGNAESLNVAAAAAIALYHTAMSQHGHEHRYAD